MSAQSPLTLYELIKQSLLRSKTIPTAALQDLPLRLFHELFMEAFVGERNEVLKAMVQAWPFPCLPLRSLMDLRKPETPPNLFKEGLQSRNLRTLTALLDGLDVQLSQKVHPSRRRLQVLDWREVHQDFWTAWPGTLRVAAGWEDGSGEKSCKPGLNRKPSLTVLAQLHFKWLGPGVGDLEEYLVRWVRKRRAAVHLYSEKVLITWGDFRTLKLRRAVQLDSIRELDVSCGWTRESMRAFVPQLKKMRNLRIFRFGCMDPRVFTSPSKNKWHSRIYAHHLGQVESLRELHVHKVFFLEGKLRKILRSQTPLEVLSLSSSPLKESDLKHLAHAPTTSQLKSLTLRDFSMTSFKPKTLRALLHTLASTLETLVLVRCGITDSHILAILPALSLCSQLKTFSCDGNRISLGTLQVLLRMSAGFSQLSHGLYPAPLESYMFKNPDTYLNRANFVKVCAQLARVLKDIRPSLRVQICTYLCKYCMKCRLYRLDPSGKWEVVEEYRYRSSITCIICEMSELGDDEFSW